MKSAPEYTHGKCLQPFLWQTLSAYCVRTWIIMLFGSRKVHYHCSSLVCLVFTLWLRKLIWSDIIQNLSQQSWCRRLFNSDRKLRRHLVLCFTWNPSHGSGQNVAIRLSSVGVFGIVQCLVTSLWILVPFVLAFHLTVWRIFNPQHSTMTEIISVFFWLDAGAGTFKLDKYVHETSGMEYKKNYMLTHWWTTCFKADTCACVWTIDSWIQAKPVWKRPVKYDW